jgi:serine/threonine-protein kinase RsbW
MKTLIFPGNYSSLSKISDFVTQTAKSLGFGSFDLYKIETAVDEACSNIIEHAYGQENKGNIEVSVIPAPDKITITLIDFGEPFNPKKIKNPNLTSNLDDRDNHGLGVYMMKQWMDVVKFEAESNRNILTLVKNLRD